MSLAVKISEFSFQDFMKSLFTGTRKSVMENPFTAAISKTNGRSNFCVATGKITKKNH